MRNGFKFNGRHSSEFGVTVRTKSRPLRPLEKTFTMDLPFRDGEYDFSSSNPQGREHFYSRTFIVSICAYADNLTQLQRKLSDLSLWLNGSGELIFDDIPLIVWRGKISDEIIYMPEHNGKSAVLEVSFRVNPFGSCVFGTDGPVIDDMVHIDDEIPISLDEFYVYSVNEDADLHIINFGDRPVRPVITIEGSAAKITLSLGDKTLSFTSNGDAAADFEKQTVSNSYGIIGVSGEFFEFGEGDNILHITNSNTADLTVNVQFSPEYMYSVDFAESKWGAVNA